MAKLTIIVSGEEAASKRVTRHLINALAMFGAKVTRGGHLAHMYETGAALAVKQLAEAEGLEIEIVETDIGATLEAVTNFMAAVDALAARGAVNG